MEWRFRSEFRSDRASIVAAEEGPRLRGYAILIRRGTSDLGLDLWDLADLQVENDDPSLVRDLLLGSMRVAREHGADALKFMTGVPFKRAAAEALRPYSYRLPLWQLYYKATTPELKSALSASDAWDFSPFDTF